MDGASGKVEIWAALVGVIAALVGAGVGGYLTYRVAHDQISATAESAAEERRATAVGTARLMRQEFDAWAKLMRDRLRAHRYARAPIHIATQLDPDIRLAVARAVDPAVWEKVAAGAGLAPNAQRLANRHSHRERLGKVDRDLAQSYETTFKNASRALKTLADEKP